MSTIGNKSIPTSIGKIPKEGPRLFNIPIYFSATVTTQTYSYQLGDLGMTMVQSIYIDNTFSAVPCVVNINGQLVTAGPNSQVFAPVLNGTNALQLTISSLGSALVQIDLINVLLPTFLSAISYGGGSVPTGSNVNVTNALLPVTFSQPVAVSQDGAWSVSASQSGAWSVAASQSGAWAVAQSGAWAVAQSGAWAVAQSGAWAVAQSGAWSVTAQQSANKLLNLTVDTLIASGAGRLYGATVNVAGAAGALHDAANIGAAAAGNMICVTPAVLGGIILPSNGVPFSNGLVYIAGAAQTVGVYY